MLPLTGITFSTTGVDNSEIDAIQAAIKGLGGDFLANLGDRPLNFLIVGRRWSEKYNFCAIKSPKTVFLTPKSLLNAQKLFQSGEHIDFLEYLTNNRLRVFGGLRITASSLSSTREKEISGIIDENGGTFTRTLNRECDLVIAENCKGKRAKFAKQWDKDVVLPEWITESIKRQVALPTKGFLTEAAGTGIAAHQLKLPAAPKAVPLDSVKDSMALVVAEDVGTIEAVDSVRDSLVDSLRESPRPEPSSPPLIDFKSGPKRKIQEYDDLFVPKSTRIIPPRPVSRPQSTEPLLQSSSGVLSGYTFSIHGFNTRESEILHKTIHSHDGSIDLPPDFFIVNSKEPKMPADASSSSSIITEWAIERSLYKKTACLEDIWGIPVYSQQLTDFEGLKICISGFKDIELVHMERLIKLLGAELCSSLTVDRDLLICASPEAQKFKYARVWRIPVVNSDWLWECAKQGKLVDISSIYALDGLGPRPAPRAKFVIAPAEPLLPQEEPNQPEQPSVYVGYGSDGSDDERTPVGRDYVKKSVPIRRSKRKQ